MTEQHERDDSTAPPFTASRARFDELVDFAGGDAAAGLEHTTLEQELESRGRELLRQLFQDHLDLRADREERLTAVTDADGTGHRSLEADHDRALATVFGQVTVRRLAYRARGRTNLHPADAALNLPVEKHSHGLRRLAATEAARGSFQEAVAAIDRGSGARVGKRQVEALTVRAAVDFNDFYDNRRPPAADRAQLLVLQVDGKGVVMRPEALRPATAKAADQATGKLGSRLSKGEKRYRKRIAEIGAVHDATPVVRTPADILPANQAERSAACDGPTATGKWLTAGIIDRRGNSRGQGLRRGHPTRPGPNTHLGRARGRCEPPNQPDPRRDRHPRPHGARAVRLRPRHRVPMEGDLVLPPRRRPGRRGLGA